LFLDNLYVEKGMQNTKDCEKQHGGGAKGLPQSAAASRFDSTSGHLYINVHTKAAAHYKSLTFNRQASVHVNIFVK
jgi:hypothetical protein